MSKQDGAYARTAADLERKYNFGRTFAEVYGLVSDAQKAADEAKAAFDGLDHDEIFNRLTNYGEYQGIYRADGDVYINAEYIKSGYLSADRIKGESITASKIAANAITTAKIDTGAITTLKIASGAVTATEIKASTITGDKIAAKAITADNIATGTITADQIASETITGDKIAAGAITADMIEVTEYIVFPESTIPTEIQTSLQDWADVNCNPSYIKGTYIDSAEIRAPTIKGGTFIGNEFNVLSESSGGSFNLYGKFGNANVHALSISYSAGDAPVVYFSGTIAHFDFGAMYCHSSIDMGGYDITFNAGGYITSLRELESRVTALENK